MRMCIFSVDQRNAHVHTRIMSTATRSALRHRLQTLAAEYRTCRTIAERRCVAETIEATLAQMGDAAPTIDQVLS